MQRSAEMIAEWQILPFDHDALENFERVKSARLKMSTLDMKIAGIALAYDATLLSRNLRDFRQVPGLRVESWLDERAGGRHRPVPELPATFYMRFAFETTPLTRSRCSCRRRQSVGLRSEQARASTPCRASIAVPR